MKKKLILPALLFSLPSFAHTFICATQEDPQTRYLSAQFDEKYSKISDLTIYEPELVLKMKKQSRTQKLDDEHRYQFKYSLNFLDEIDPKNNTFWNRIFNDGVEENRYLGNPLFYYFLTGGYEFNRGDFNNFGFTINKNDLRKPQFKAEFSYAYHIVRLVCKQQR